MRDTKDVLFYIGLLNPTVCLGNTLEKMQKILAMRNRPNISIYLMTDDACGLNLLFFIMSGFFYLTLCILKDMNVFGKLLKKLHLKNEKFPTSTNMDSDVEEEIEKVNLLTEAQVKETVLVVENLSKFYGNFLAVNQLCLSVDRGECFGLLGINGAGKTTTFKLLTGDEDVYLGDAFIQGVSLKYHKTKANKLIGYCPQIDALLLDLTGRETLILFCLLRGIPKSEMEIVYSNLSADLGFFKYLDKQVKVYSGGNKRKLSTALALLGDPNLILLDEPTSGL